MIFRIKYSLVMVIDKKQRSIARKLRNIIVLDNKNVQRAKYSHDLPTRAVCLISVTHLRPSCERKTEKRLRKRWNEGKGEKGESDGKKATMKRRMLG